MSDYCALHPNYDKNDMFKHAAFYDIESLPNIFTLAIVYPAYKRSEIFYATTDELAKNLQGDNWANICKTIKDVNPELKEHQITPINIADNAGQVLLNDRFPYQPSSLSAINNFNDININCNAAMRVSQRNAINMMMYPNNNVNNSITMDAITHQINNDAGKTLNNYNSSHWFTFYGYNSIDYDMTMLALLAQYLVCNPNNNAYSGSAIANYMYTCNTLLFSHIGMNDNSGFTRQHNMSSVLYKNGIKALNDGLCAAARMLRPDVNDKTWDQQYAQDWKNNNAIWALTSQQNNKQHVSNKQDMQDTSNMQHANDKQGKQDMDDKQDTDDKQHAKDKQYANTVYRNWRKTNRYLDAMNRQKTPPLSLKKTASILGRKIKESSKLSAKQAINNNDELADLIAYNYCDVLNTAAAYGTDFMQDFFNDRNALMQMFPSTVLKSNFANSLNNQYPYQAAKYIMANNSNIRYNRSLSDDTSANFAIHIIAPDINLQDNPHVSFAFPKATFNNNHDTEVTKAENRKLLHWIADENINLTIQNALQEQNEQWCQQLENMSFTAQEKKTLTNMLKANDKLTTPYPVFVFNDEQPYVLEPSPNFTDVSKPFEPDNSNTNDIIRLYDENAKCSYDALDDMLMWSWEQDQQYHTHNFENIMPTYACYNWLRGRDFSEGVNNPYPSDTKIGNKKDLALWFKLTSGITYYLNEHDQKTDCIVNFSYGGLHGAQINLAGFQRDQEAAKNVNDISSAVEATLKAKHAKSKKELLKEHGDTRLVSDNPAVHKLHVKDVLAGNSQLYKKFQTGPKLFDKDGKLNKAYTMTSNNWTAAGKRLLVFHADFKSYYPTLIKRLNMFGATYSALYDTRLRYKSYWKKGVDDNGRQLTDAEKRDYERKATTLKLMLNAPTGKADENIPSKITMHNNIIAMRSIGQTFTWRIGQALSLRGAKVVSTNTDGLYIYVDAQNDNPNYVHNQQEVQAVINQTVKSMLIGVDADELYQFISRDTNNRVEVVKTADNQLEIDDARGGDLAAYRDNRLDKSTTMPPLLNRVLADYLASGITDISAPFNVNNARKLMMRYINEVLNANSDQLRSKAEHLLTRLGWTVSGNNSLNTYLLGHHLTTNYSVQQHAFAPVLDDQQRPKVDLLQRDNRIYFTVPSGNEFITLDKVAARKVAKHDRQDPDTNFAAHVMQQQLAKQASVSYQELSAIKKFSIQVYTKMPKSITPLNSEDPNALPSWVHVVDQLPEVKCDDYYQDGISLQPITIINDSIADLETDELLNIIKHLDIDAYLGMLRETFNTWRNN